MLKLPKKNYVYFFLQDRHIFGGKKSSEEKWTGRSSKSLSSAKSNEKATLEFTHCSRDRERDSSERPTKQYSLSHIHLPISEMSAVLYSSHFYLSKLSFNCNDRYLSNSCRKKIISWVFDLQKLKCWKHSKLTCLLPNQFVKLLASQTHLRIQDWPLKPWKLNLSNIAMNLWR